MTVGELRAALADLPDDLLVVADDRYVITDIEIRRARVAVDKDGWGEGAYLELLRPEEQSRGVEALLL